MHPTVNGDFSNYPESLRAIFPRVQHSVFELRQLMATYHYLFMDRRERTSNMGEVLGPLLGITQGLLDEWIILATARMLDDGKGDRSVLSLRHLVNVAQTELLNPDDKQILSAYWRQVETLATNVPQYRNKVVGHIDLGVGLGQRSIVEPIWSELDETGEAMVLVLKWITILFTSDLKIDAADPRFGTAQDPRLSGIQYVFRGRDNSWVAEMATYKAKAYDELVRNEIITRDAWRKFDVSP